MSNNKKLYRILLNIVIFIAYSIFINSLKYSPHIALLTGYFSLMLLLHSAYFMHSQNPICLTKGYLALCSFSIGYCYFVEYSILGEFILNQAMIFTVFSIFFLIPPFDWLSARLSFSGKNRDNLVEIAMQFIFAYVVFLYISNAILYEKLSYIILIFSAFRCFYEEQELTALSLSKIYIATLLLLFSKSIDLNLLKKVFISLFVMTILYEMVIFYTKKILLRNIVYVLSSVAPLFFIHEITEIYLITIYLLLLHIFLPKISISYKLRSIFSGIVSNLRNIKIVNINPKIYEISISRVAIQLSFAITLIFFIIGSVLLV